MSQLYSVWIVPRELSRPLKATIDRLAEEYKSPKFEPHLTLLSQVEGEKEEMIDKAKKLAAELSPFDLSLGEVAMSTTYYQCVFVRVRPTAKLIEANLKAKEIFKLENDVFMPHISLAYGDFAPQTREEMMGKVILPQERDFRAEVLTMVPVTEDPAGWEHLIEAPLIG
ncbi:MAG: 2 3 cyclic phosphodiesterase [Candidatus Beckwithbacteria bacterium GW2011_GWB1_47_15]|uniref:2 3 cyclic phosphodiesterase n=1 Tax=Candidatus Beckwithbacteria bacterium GW2011_GWB1_47_15 TaxID=1618371 RepID=A0A0G1RSX2_9BACT|nr:MAG: cyclic phosphodiesterase-like protein [Candidatus Beckwithbacteria bacterium GW2011_GWC1_49_16]KKU34683.1 MAG: 2 3 cyclic phosphodiesterase [Candidatus Beckwithbacteria bacterium GW2011_GWA1_46_30]KKU60429.1 MAG: 2 3 cyclic phosphodiesterase [Candidatus Beckwithbacteria bacterium GW2011_GWB1_47_15]KKU71612.1 MAG: 2 3 cyclic phosphodiesterase [Candidatus Beckwithbacteria bacterium GW2011_GWA2_47_25]OGD48190.1 MAG: hypothetical protein A2877_02870 [Candidatus Beckwithbacteria bacterium RI